jgi:uncharacterized protein (DUF58 family)
MPPNDSATEISTALRAASDHLFLRKLQRLRLAARHSLFSQHPGNTPVPRATQEGGLELADHKVYAPGDDLRHVDWNAYGRLDQKLVKRFRAEREAPLHLLIDTSASMAVPKDDAKLAFAAGLAASLAYISLRQHDPVRAVALRERCEPGQVSPLIRHPHRLAELLGFFSRLTPGGRTFLGDGIDAYLRTTQLPGIAVVLSDFLVLPAVYEVALERLRARGHQVAAVRLIGPRERDPGTLPRRVRLRDAESGKERVVDVTADHRARYAAALRDHLARLRHWCEGRSIMYVAADTDAGIETCLLSELPRVGLLH